MQEIPNRIRTGRANSCIVSQWVVPTAVYSFHQRLGGKIGKHLEEESFGQVLPLAPSKGFGVGVVEVADLVDVLLILACEYTPKSIV